MRGVARKTSRGNAHAWQQRWLPGAAAAVIACAGCTPLRVAVPAPAGNAPAAPDTLRPSPGDHPQEIAVQGSSQGVLENVSEIVLERDGQGQPQGLRVRLGRDGRIEHTRTGHGRFGTTDETRTAALTSPEFEALVQLLRAQRFDALRAVYDDPETADGAWALLRVTHASGHTQVWWREDQRPAAVQPIEAAVIALGRRAGPIAVPEP